MIDYNVYYNITYYTCQCSHVIVYVQVLCKWGHLQMLCKLQKMKFFSTKDLGVILV